MSRFNQQGFTFLTVVFAIVLIGISLSAAGQQWKTVVQRDREEELLFRGNQIKRAIEAYYRDASAPAPGTAATKHGVSLYPSCGMEGDDCFRDLLGDPAGFKKRYLRKAFNDPMTNGSWGLITTANNRLIGVRSKSTKAPMKKANFPEEYKCFEQAASYEDWVFRFVPAAAPTAGAAVVEEEPCMILPKAPVKKP